MQLINAVSLSRALLRGEVEASNDLIVRAYNTLADVSGDVEEYADLMHSLHDVFAWVIDNHDERGNYIGSVSGENGWTA